MTSLVQLTEEFEDSIIFEEDEDDENMDDDDDIDGWGDDDDGLVFDETTEYDDNNNDDELFLVPKTVEDNKRIVSSSLTVNNGICIDNNQTKNENNNNYAESETEVTTTKQSVSSQSILVNNISNEVTSSSSLSTGEPAMAPTPVTSMPATTDSTTGIKSISAASKGSTFGWNAAAVTSTSTGNWSNSATNGHVNVVSVSVSTTEKSPASLSGFSSSLSPTTTIDNLNESTNDNSGNCSNNTSNINEPINGNDDKASTIEQQEQEQQHTLQVIRTPARVSKMPSPKAFSKSKQTLATINTTALKSTLSKIPLSNTKNSVTNNHRLIVKPITPTMKDSTNMTVTSRSSSTATTTNAATIIVANPNSKTPTLKIKDSCTSNGRSVPGSSVQEQVPSTYVQSPENNPVFGTESSNGDDNENNLSEEGATSILKGQMKTGTDSDVFGPGVSPSLGASGSIWQHLAVTAASVSPIVFGTPIVIESLSITPSSQESVIKQNVTSQIRVESPVLERNSDIEIHESTSKVLQSTPVSSNKSQSLRLGMEPKPLSMDVQSNVLETQFDAEIDVDIDNNNAEDDNDDYGDDDDFNEWDDDILDLDDTTNNDDNSSDAIVQEKTTQLAQVDGTIPLDFVNQMSPVLQPIVLVEEEYDAMPHDQNDNNKNKDAVHREDTTNTDQPLLQIHAQQNGFTHDTNESFDNIMELPEASKTSTDERNVLQSEEIVLPVYSHHDDLTDHLPESIALRELQNHFHKQLQTQYELVEKKNKQIQHLQTINSSTVNEKKLLEDELYNCQHQVLPLYQIELLALASERDVLTNDLVQTNRGLELFQTLHKDIQNKHQQKVQAILNESEQLKLHLLQHDDNLCTMKESHYNELETIQTDFGIEKNKLLDQLELSKDEIQRYQIENHSIISSNNETIQNHEREIQLLQQTLSDVEHQMHRILCRTNAPRRIEQSSGEGTEGTMIIINNSSSASYSNGNTTIGELVQKLEIQSTSKDDEIQRLEEVIESMTFHEEDQGDDVRDLRSSNDLLHEENISLREQIRQLDQDYQSMITNNDELIAAKSHADNIVAQKMQEFEHLRRDFQYQQEDFKNQTAQFETAKAAEILSLSNKLQEVNNSLTLKSKDNSQMLHQIEQLSNQYQETNFKLQEVQNNLDASVQDSLNIVEPIQQELQRVQTDYKKSESDRQKSIKHLVDLSKELKHVQQQSHLFEQHIKELEQNISHVSSERDEAVIQQSDLWNKIEELQSNHSMAMQTIIAERSLLLETNNELEYKLLSLRKEFDSVLLSKSESSYKESEMTQMINTLQDEILQMTNDHEGIVARLEKERDKTIQSSEALLQSRTNTVNDQMQKLKNENEELFVQFARMNLKYEHMMSDISKQKEMEQLSQSKLDEVINQNRDLISLAESLIEERDDLLKHVTVLQVSTENNDTITSDLQKTQNELCSLQELYQKQQEEMVSLRQHPQVCESNGNDKECILTNTDIAKNDEVVNKLEQKCETLHMDLQIMQDSHQKTVLDLELQIEMLTKSVATIEGELTEAKTIIMLKDDQINELAYEKETIQFQNNALKDKFEVKRTAAVGSETDVDSLRTYIVTLAQSLVLSEKKHAQAVEALVNERATNAEKFQKLSQNMKQYYSSISLLSGTSPSGHKLPEQAYFKDI
jgi:hypothetical protein